MLDIALEDSLKLKNCPRCDYSLQGSPAMGICPECGESYNDDYIVLRGRPVLLHPQPNGQRPVSTAKFAWSATIAVICTLLFLRVLPGWTAAIFIFPTFLLQVRSAIVVAGARRNGEVLVWLCPLGAGQQTLVDADSASGKITEALSTIRRVGQVPTTLLIWWAIIVTSATGPSFVPLLIATGIFGISVAVSYLVDKGARPRFVQPAAGIRPPLLPWTAFEGIELEDLSGGSFQFWTKKSRRIRRMDVTNIEFTVSREGAGQLFDLIQRWAGPAVPVTLKKSKWSRPPRWPKRAGLFIRSLIHRTR